MSESAGKRNAPFGCIIGCVILAIVASPPVMKAVFLGTVNARESMFLWSVCIALILTGSCFWVFGRTQRSLALLWISLFGCLLGLGTLELGARLLYQPDEALRMYEAPPAGKPGFQLKPNLSIETQVGTQPASLLTSEIGLRVPQAFADHSKEVTQAPERVVFSGDSFTFGLWAESAEKTFVHQVGQTLGSQKVSVHNLGVPGYGVEDSLRLLKQHWEQLDPTMVVLCLYNGNDFLDSYLGTERYTVRSDGLLVLNQKLVNEKIPVEYQTPGGQLEQWLENYCYSARMLVKTISAFSGKSADPSQGAPKSLSPDSSYRSNHFWSLEKSSPLAKAATEETIKQIKQFADFVRGKNAKLLIVAIPYVEQVVIPEKFSDGYSVRLPQAHFRDVCDDESIPYLDLQPILSASYAREKDAFYLYFDGHFNNRGHSRAAKAIAEVIEQEFLN